MKKYIGTYYIGPGQAKLFLRSGYGGDFSWIPADGKISEICIGADHKEWRMVISTLIHETMEYAMTQIGVRYCPSVDWGEDNGAYTFVMSHTEFSEACGRAARFIEDAANPLQKAWREYHKPKSRARKTDA